MSVKKKKKESVVESGIHICHSIAKTSFSNFEKNEDYGVAKVAIGACKSMFQGVSLLAQSKRLTGMPADIREYTGE